MEICLIREERFEIPEPSREPDPIHIDADVAPGDIIPLGDEGHYEIMAFMSQQALTDKAVEPCRIAAQALKSLFRIAPEFKEEEASVGREHVDWGAYLQDVNHAILRPANRIVLIPFSRTAYARLRKRRLRTPGPLTPFTGSLALHKAVDRYLQWPFRKRLGFLGTKASADAWEAVYPFIHRMMTHALLGDTWNTGAFAGFIERLPQGIPVRLKRGTLFVLSD